MIRYYTFLFWLIAVGSVCAQAPRHVYLTWQGDPSSTITVNAQTLAPAEDLVVYYDTQPRGSDVEAYQHQAEGTTHQIDGLPDGRWIHWIELTGLVPDTPYYFIVGSTAQGFSEELTFRTLPDDDRPVRFVTGGDLGVGEEVNSLLRHAAEYEPRFALIGGDIAYVNGNLQRVATWDQWFDAWRDYMVTPEGFIIPMVLAVGNHEVQGGYNGGPGRSPFYMGFFAQSGNPSYFRFPVGENFVIYVLDSGHIVSHESQVAWLTEQMQADQDIPYRFAAYHVPLYPSHRDYDGTHSEYGRMYWRPLFDQYRLTTAFENHDHTFKRSKRLKAGAIAEDGTLYLGDGAWGRGDRTIDLTPRWYLDKAGANRHVWVVDVSKEKITYRAFDTQGKVFDIYPTDTPGYAEADAYFRTLPQLYAFDEAALDVTPLSPLEDDFESTAVRVTLQNTEAYPAEVSVEFDLEAPLSVSPSSMALDLAPGGAAVVNFQLSASTPVPPGLFPQAMIQANFTFMRENEEPVQLTAVERIAAERAFTAEPRSSAVTLDGSLDDWGELEYAFTQAAPHENGPGRWQGPADASLHFAAAYDDTRLYLAFRVVDDQVVIASEGENLWSAEEEQPLQDAILMWLDPHPDGDGDDDPYMAIAPHAADGKAHVIVADEDHRDLAEATRAAARRNEEGYTLEIAVPLAVLEDEDDLQAIRMNLAISDLDAPGETPDVIFWRPQWESERDYEGFGVVSLSARQTSGTAGR